MITEEMKRLHKEAVQDGKKVYRCPETGYNVMTAEYLSERGYCCSSGCRHCPYDGWEEEFDEDDEWLDSEAEYDYTSD